MYYGPESLKSEEMSAVEITKNDRQQSDYIPEIEEPDDRDDDTNLEEEATPLANEVYFLSWLRGQDYIFSMPIEADYCVEYISAIYNTASKLFV